MIDDLFLLGIASGLLANIPINFLDYILYRTGINKVFIWHISASTHVEKKDIKSVSGLLLGAFNDYIMAGIKGVLITYTLYLTGLNLYVIKGIAIGLFLWLLCFGIFLRLKIARIDPVEPATNLTHFSWHVLLGGLIAWLAVLLGNLS